MTEAGVFLERFSSMNQPRMQFYHTQFPPNRQIGRNFFQNKTLHHEAGYVERSSHQNQFNLQFLAGLNTNTLGGNQKGGILEKDLKEFLKACFVQACFRCLFCWPSVNISLNQVSFFMKRSQTMAEQRDHEINNNNNNTINPHNPEEVARRQIIMEIAGELRNIGDSILTVYENSNHLGSTGSMRNSSADNS